MGLSSLADQIKVVIKWVLIAAGALAVVWFLFFIFLAAFNAILPPKKVAPKAAFGHLPVPITSNVSLNTVEVDLDTPDGSLPSNPQLLEVYPIPEPAGKVNSLDLATSKASQLGVKGAAKSLSPTLYQWQDVASPNRSISIDIVNGTFNYRYDWIADPGSISRNFTEPVAAEAEKLAKNFFLIDLPGTNDLVEGSIKSHYVRISGANYNRVSSPSEANAVEVNISRQQIKGKYEVVDITPERSLINALVSPINTQQAILEANFVHWLIDFDKGSTYPLRTSAQAFNDLKDGKAYIVSGNIEGLDRIKVADVKIAYLETETYSAYLQPIYVFSGDAFAGRTKVDFLAYLPAVESSYINSGL